MGAEGVVVDPPVFDDPSRRGKVREDVLAQALVAEPGARQSRGPAGSGNTKAAPEGGFSASRRSCSRWLRGPATAVVEHTSAVLFKIVTRKNNIGAHLPL